MASTLCLATGVTHLNAGVKIDMQCYKNSTHDVDIIFDRVRLCNTFTRELRQHMEPAFSPYMPDAHTTPSAVLDMLSLARSLFSSKLGAPRPEADLYGKYFDSAVVCTVWTNTHHLLGLFVRQLKCLWPPSTKNWSSISVRRESTGKTLRCGKRRQREGAM